MGGGPRRRPANAYWWRALTSTVLAIVCLNLLVGYLVARAVFPGTVPPMPSSALVAWALACIVFAAATILGWRKYVQVRRGQRA